MSTLVTGTIDSPDENRSRIEPTGPILLGVLQPGTGYNKQIGTYSNNGNVNQTVTVDVDCIDNEVGITYQGTRWQDSNGQTITNPSITLAPGKSAVLYLQFTADNNGPGPDLNVSFEVTPVWS
jgi:hypothetical protein